jgi:hypothetical protein
MKTFIRLGFFVLLMAMTACQKELSYELGNGTPNGNGNPTGVNGVLKMKIDGQQWVADKVASASIIQGVVAIGGMSNSRKTFILRLDKDRLGDFLLSQDSFHIMVLSDSTENPFSYATNEGNDTTESVGHVRVSKIDTTRKTISGTFNGKLYRALDGKTRMITEGVFENLSYTTTLPPVNSKDTFRVKIDGAGWTPQSVTGAAISFTNQLSIVANDATATKTVGITMPLNITPGTYNLDFFGLTYIGQYNLGSTYLASQSGKLTILEHNVSTKRIRGNFNFVGKELLGPQTAQITEGYFSVIYQ